MFLVLLFWTTVFSAVVWKYRKTEFLGDLLRTFVEYWQTIWYAEDMVTGNQFDDPGVKFGLLAGFFSSIALAALVIAAFIWSIVWAW